MTETKLKLFKYEKKSVRTTKINWEIRFSWNDIVSILGYKNIHDAIKKHCEKKWVAKRDTLTRMWVRKLVFINESNIYRLINKSKTEWAERFKNWIVEKLLPQIRKYGDYNKNNELPDFAKRYKLNAMKIPYNYFSVINQLYPAIYAELEKVWHTIPDKAEDWATIQMDISVWQTFAKYLEDNNHEYYKSREKYIHEYPDWREVEAYMYTIDALPLFIRFVHNIRLKDYAEDYFKKRDPEALKYIPLALWITIEEIRADARRIRMRQGLVKKNKIKKK